MWIPAQMQLQVSLLKQQLKTDYKLAAEIGRIRLRPHGLTHAALILDKVEIKHPIGHGTVPLVRIYVPLWPLVQEKTLHISEVILEQPRLALKDGWTDYVWPKPQKTSDRPLQGGELKVVNGYHVTLPDNARVEGPGLVWQKLDMPDSPMHVAGTFTLPTLKSPFDGTATFQQWVIEKAHLLTRPALQMDQFSPAEQRAIKQAGLHTQTLPDVVVDWTPKGWQAQSQPAELTVNVDRRKLVLNRLQAIGRSQGKQVWIDAARLHGQWIDTVAKLPAQPWQLLAQGHANLARNTLKATTELPPDTRLQGIIPQVGRCQFQGQITSQWSGTFQKPLGVHRVVASRLVSPYGQQQARLVLQTVGSQWIDGYIQQLSGQFRQAQVRVQGRVNLAGFQGQALVSQFPLTPKQLAGFGPLPVRPVAGRLDATVQRIQWANPAQSIVAHAQLQHVVVHGYPQLNRATVDLRGPLIALQQATVAVGGSQLNAQGQINTATERLQLKAQGKQLDIATLRQQLPQYMAQVPPSVTGKADVDAVITGTVKHPQVDADLRLRQLQGRVQQVSLQNGQIDVQYRRNQWIARVLQGVVGYQGIQPVALQGEFRGVGDQLQHIALQTGGVNLSDVSQALGVPVQSGSAQINVSQRGKTTLVNAVVRDASTTVQGHTLRWTGDVSARLPKPLNKLTARDLNAVWVDVPLSQLVIDGMPMQVAATGYPMSQLLATTQLETGQLWQLPALSNWVAKDTPPYQHLLAQWFITPDLIRMDRLEARDPVSRVGVLPVMSATQSMPGTAVYAPATTVPNNTVLVNVTPAEGTVKPKKYPDLPQVYPLHQHVSLLIQPKQRDHWLKAGLNLSDIVSLSVLEPYLNPAFFEGLAGDVHGQMQFDMGLVGFATGSLQANKFTLPKLDVKPLDTNVLLAGTEGHLSVANVTVPGVKDTHIEADLPQWHDWPLHLENARLEGKEFHIGRFQQYIKDVIVDKVSKQLVTPVAGEWKPGNEVLPFELKSADTRFNEVIYQNIILSDVTGHLDVLASSYTAFRQAKLTAAQGEVTGDITLDPIANNFLTLNMHANHVQANPLTRALLNISNQIFGEVTGDIRFTTSGNTEVENLQNTNGTGSINVRNGRIPALTRVEALMTGANLVRTGVLGLSLNNIMRILWPFELNDFKDMSTDMQFTNGKVYMVHGMRHDNTPIRPLQVKNPNLRIEAEGSIGLVDAYADMIIYGRMEQNVKGAFGKVGQVSLLYLLGHIPGINLGKGRNLLAYIPGVGFVPGFGGPPQKGKVNYFTVRVKGPFGEPGSIKDLRWAKPEPMHQDSAVK